MHRNRKCDEPWRFQMVYCIATYTEKYNEKVCFYYDADFLKNGLDIAPLRASVNSQLVKSGLPVYADRSNNA